jgi:predicted  nucleic acid-binding Zn-ribbon protein
MLETIKTVLMGVLVVALVAGGVSYYKAWHGAQDKINKAQEALEIAQTETLELKANVAALTEEQEKLDAEISDKKTQISQYNADIATLKDDLKVANQKIAVETDEQTIANDFKRAYELTDRNVKIILLPETTSSGKIFKNKFLAMPIDVSKLMTQTKNNAVACGEEVVLKDQISALTADILTLTNEKLDLEREKTQAWSEGYYKAFSMYESINTSYINLLKAPPKVNLAPKWLQVLGGFASGLALCAF